MRRASARPAATTSQHVAPTDYSGGRMVRRDVTPPAPSSHSFDDGSSRYLPPADRHRPPSRPWHSQPSTAAARPTTSVVVVFVAAVCLLCAVRSGPCVVCPSTVVVTIDGRRRYNIDNFLRHRIWR